MNYTSHLKDLFAPYFDDLKIDEDVYSNIPTIALQGYKGNTIYAFSFYLYELEILEYPEGLNEFLTKFLSELFRDRDIATYLKKMKGV